MKNNYKRKQPVNNFDESLLKFSFLSLTLINENSFIEMYAIKRS